MQNKRLFTTAKSNTEFFLFSIWTILIEDCHLHPLVEKTYCVEMFLFNDTRWCGTLPSFFFPPSGRHLLLFPSTGCESLLTRLLPSGLCLSPSASQSFLKASYHPVYSSFWNLIPFFLPARPVSALDGLL